MTALPIMPVRTDSLLSDTSHLSAEEFGAYCRILFTMWQHGGRLPDDPKELARIAGMTRQKWNACHKTVMRPMTIIEGVISQKRLSATWLHVQELRQKRAGAANVRWASKHPSNSNANALHVQSNSNAIKTKKKIEPLYSGTTSEQPEPQQASGLPTKQASTPEQNPPTENLAVSEALKATVREKGWAKPGTTGPPRQANGLGDGRSLDQIVRDKGWTAEEPPITSKLLA